MVQQPVTRYIPRPAGRLPAHSLAGRQISWPAWPHVEPLPAGPACCRPGAAGPVPYTDGLRPHGVGGSVPDESFPWRVGYVSGWV